MLKYGLSLYLGQHKLNVTDTYEQERAIEKLIIHPGFSPSPVYDYDVPREVQHARPTRVSAEGNSSGVVGHVFDLSQLGNLIYAKFSVYSMRIFDWLT